MPATPKRSRYLVNYQKFTDCGRNAIKWCRDGQLDFLRQAMRVVVLLAALLGVSFAATGFDAIGVSLIKYTIIVFTFLA
ncbi:hypothetical protein OESDEN_03343 [Oesophagostomum dentatum]|uniref:Uncharacterized protein n=1 Tax=Oesophagostomum dentatum TaxID=61180 RepID=A0A0B1TMT9_OESDE|nr:hypothetical protein OESDEN_03343 [Oesophagostomum dentatum]